MNAICFPLSTPQLMDDEHAKTRMELAGSLYIAALGRPVVEADSADLKSFEASSPIEVSNYLLGLLRSNEAINVRLKTALLVKQESAAAHREKIAELVSKFQWTMGRSDDDVEMDAHTIALLSAHFAELALAVTGDGLL